MGLISSARDALSRGGEIFGAYLLRRKASAFDVLKALDKKYGPATPDTLGEILSMSMAGLTAGSMLDRGLRKGAIDPSQLPTNPYLFGGDKSKGRYFIGGAVGPPGGPPELDVNIILGASIGWDEILEQMISSIDVMNENEKYKKLVEWLNPSQQIEANIWFAEGQD